MGDGSQPLEPTTTRAAASRPSRRCIRAREPWSRRRQRACGWGPAASFALDRTATVDKEKTSNGRSTGPKQKWEGRGAVSGRSALPLGQRLGRRGGRRGRGRLRGRGRCRGLARLGLGPARRLGDGAGDGRRRRDGGRLGLGLGLGLRPGDGVAGAGGENAVRFWRRRTAPTLPTAGFLPLDDGLARLHVVAVAVAVAVVFVALFRWKGFSAIHPAGDDLRRRRHRHRFQHKPRGPGEPSGWWTLTSTQSRVTVSVFVLVVSSVTEIFFVLRRLSGHPGEAGGR